jgi:hypothetical protein
MLQKVLLLVVGFVELDIDTPRHYHGRHRLPMSLSDSTAAVGEYRTGPYCCCRHWQGRSIATPAWMRTQQPVMGPASWGVISAAACPCRRGETCRSLADASLGWWWWYPEVCLDRVPPVTRSREADQSFAYLKISQGFECGYWFPTEVVSRRQNPVTRSRPIICVSENIPRI